MASNTDFWAAGCITTHKIVLRSEKQEAGMFCFVAESQKRRRNAKTGYTVT